jgi:bile acid:Na+ symporter, BASS family
VGLPALAFNLVSLATGYLLPQLFKLERKQATAISMEIGIHNATLAIAIASSPTLLNNSEMALPAAVYGLLMFVTAGLFGTWLTRRRMEAA